MAAVAGKTESRTARFRAMARVTGQGKDQGAEGHTGLRLKRKENHLWAASAQAVVKAVRCVSNRTRPVSWLGPETSGVHPHTKGARCFAGGHRSEEHTSELQALMRISYAVFCLTKKKHSTKLHQYINPARNH